MSFMNVIPGALAGGAGPGPTPIVNPNYLNTIESIVDTGTIHYWNFQDGGDYKGPFRDWGTASATIDLTPNEDDSVFGFVHCGPRGPQYVGGVTAKKWNSSDTSAQAQHIDGDAMPLFTGPGAIGFWARRGTAAEKHLMLLEVENAGATTQYRTRVKILSDGKLQLTIEIPGSGNSVVVETSAAIWGSGSRMSWRFIVINQPDDGGGIDLYVDGVAAPVKRTYNGTATAATWIDDMLAWGGRSTAADLFRLFGDENGNGGDEFSEAGIGGLFIVQGQELTSGNIGAILAAAAPSGAATEYVEAIIRTLDEQPVWWWNSHPVDAGGTQPNTARSGFESNLVDSVGQALPTELRGEPLSDLGRRYAAFTADGLSAFADRISGQSADANANWKDWDYTSGSFIARVVAPAFAGSNLYTLFCWGQEPTGGPALQEGIVVFAPANTGSPSSYTNALRVAFYKREGGVARVWWRDFDAQLTNGQEFTLYVVQDGTGPRVWVDGTEITTTNDVTNGGTTAASDWFGSIRTAAGGSAGITAFRVGPYINASGFSNWTGRVEDFLITDEVLTQTDIDAIEAAIADASAWEPSTDFITLTVGKSGAAGSEKVGFDVDDSFGSCSGAPDFLAGGDAVEEFFWSNTTDEITFRVSGTYSQEAFKYLYMASPYGQTALYARKAKTHTQAGGKTTWVWDAPSPNWAYYAASDAAKIWFVESEAAAPTTASEYESELISAGANHYWALSEVSGDFRDSIGNWHFTVDADNVQRGVVGPFRGIPYTPQYVQDDGAVGLSHSATVSERLLGTTGAIGGFLGVGRATSNTELFELLRGEYNGDATLFWRLYMDTVGRVFMELQQGGTSNFYARWEWNGAAVTNAWKTTAGDNRASGEKLVFVCVVQRADGTGPKLSINGATPIAASATVFGTGSGDDDSWMAALDAAVGTTTSYAVKTKDDGLAIAAPFVFDGSAPTDQQIADIYAGANVSGDATDYCEYVRAIEPVLWKSPTSGETTGLQTMAWQIRNIGDVATWTAPNPLMNSQQWSQDALSREVPWPAGELPGMKYRINGFKNPTLAATPSAYVRNEDTEFSDEWTAGNDLDTGTLCIIFRWPSDTTLQFLVDFKTTFTNFELAVRTVGDSLQFYSQRGSFSNRIVINLDRPVAVGDLCMVCYNQTGSQIDTYVNGVLRDGGDIGTTITGTASGSDWFHTLRASQRFNWQIGSRRGLSNNVFIEDLYDCWVKRGTPLTGAQIKDLWDLVSGAVSSATPP